MRSSRRFLGFGSDQDPDRAEYLPPFQYIDCEFFFTTTVLKDVVWSNVFSDGIRRMVYMRVISSWSIPRGLILLLEFLWENWWDLEEVASQDRRWQTWQERKV